MLYLPCEVVQYLAVAFFFEVEREHIFDLGPVAQLPVVQFVNQVLPLLLAREQTELHEFGEYLDGVVHLLHDALGIAELVVLAFHHDLFDAVQLVLQLLVDYFLENGFDHEGGFDNAEFVEHILQLRNDLFVLLHFLDFVFLDVGSGLGHFKFLEDFRGYLHLFQNTCLLRLYLFNCVCGRCRSLSFGLFYFIKFGFEVLESV